MSCEQLPPVHVRHSFGDACARPFVRTVGRTHRWFPNTTRIDALGHVLSRSDFGAARSVALLADGFRIIYRDPFYDLGAVFLSLPGHLQLFVMLVLQCAFFLLLMTPT